MLMRIGLFLIGIIVVSLFDPVLGQSQPEELGLIKWNRDLDLAQSLSLKTKKPILILFQEIPGCGTCKSYGNKVLSHPFILESIETYFVPLAIYNNKQGKDKNVLDLFGEPAWNNPVVRIVDAKLNPIVDRLNGNYSTYGLLSKITTTLLKTNQKIPKYLELFEEELQAKNTGTEKMTFGMYCFWSGEKNYGKINGVVSTTAGFMSGREVVEVEYNPKLISGADLIKQGQKVNCADEVYLDKKNKSLQEHITIKEYSTFKADKELKYYLFNTKYKHIPMSALQAAKINSLLSEGKSIEFLLSPYQLMWLEKIKDVPKNKLANYIGKDFELAFQDFNKQLSK